jgi:acyl-CoA reductase-like NAD-dependent aldehyde dehydrogenase
MGSPVKVADELFEAAKETAPLANRSIAKQIEHWARLGRAVEQLAKTTDVMAFKAQLADPQDATKVVQARAALKRLVEALADRMDVDAARRLILETGKPVYEAVPDRPDLVSQVWPDGRRVLGRVVEQEFVAEELTGKKASRLR